MTERARGSLRRTVLAGAAAIGMAVAAVPCAAAASAVRPNIVLIVLDDVGFSDLGPFGSEIRTPSIDAIARDGVRYNRFDSKAVCSATRAALLTGRNSQTVRMADLIVVLDGARVVEVGSHEALMAKGGQYAELYGIQAAAYR